MSKFKADDVVECINTEGISLDPDYTYTVNWCNEKYVSIECAGGTDIFSPERFKLANSPATFALSSHCFFYAEDEDEYDNNELSSCEKALRYEMAVSLLERAAQRLEDCHQYELAEEINSFLGDEE